MRVKPVPEPPEDLDTVYDAWKAVPLVPASTAECCYRLMDALELPSQDRARTWLTLLRGLGFVTASDHGFARVHDPVPDVSDAFLTGIYGAREIMAILEAANDPLSAAAVYRQFESQVPEWETHRSTAWQTTWHKRVEHLLEWLRLLGLVETTASGYVAD